MNRQELNNRMGNVLLELQTLAAAAAPLGPVESGLRGACNLVAAAKLELRATACPHDTAGTGDCGRRRCPVCGPLGSH